MHSTRHDPTLAALHASSSLPGHVLDVVVLTADAGLLATLREASASEHAIWQAPSAEAAVDLLVGGRCGILIADLGTLRSDAAALLDRLHVQFPELILLATGKREEESAVASLVSDGRVYRFLHKPISPARASLFIGAATRRYYELRNTPEPFVLTTVRTIAARPRLLGKIVATVVALVILIVAAFIALRDVDEVEFAPAPDSGLDAARIADQVQSLLGSAQIAIASRRIHEPRGDNALEYYRRALALQPDHPDARAGVATVLRMMESNVVAALQAGDARQASLALTALQRAQPDHPRLEPLRDQLVQLSRTLGRSTAPPPPPSVPAPVAATTPSLSSDVATSATIEPEASAAEPSDLAPETPPQSSDETPAASPTGSDESIVAEELAIAVRMRERDQLIAPAGNNAYELVTGLRAREPDSAVVAAEVQRLAFVLLDRARTALLAGDLEQAHALLSPAESLVPGMAAMRTLRQQLTTAQQQRDFTTRIAQAAELKRTREVPAAYPRDAERRGIEGWVDVEFTIAPDGTTTDLVVRNAQPLNVFDRAALESVSRWRFVPIVRGGVAVPQRAVLRVRFALQ